jgi:quercetin dioxygenase-like cupin family protein
MESDHVARVKNLKGSDVAFLDQRIPAYEREIITMMGRGVIENPDLAPHVKVGAHGFTMAYVRAPKGKGAALHRHATEEVFWLEGDTERSIDLDTGDTCNVPIGIYRGFRNLDDNPDALLLAIVGGPDTGKVDWHPSVVEEARRTGLSVDDDGNLIVEKPAA